MRFTREEELALIERAQRGDRVAMGHLIRSIDDFAATKARRFVWEPYISFDDAMQEARFGIMEAVRRFRPEFGAKLITYAGMWILSKLQDYEERTFGDLRVPGRSRRGRARNIRAMRLDRPVRARAGDSTVETLADRLAAQDADPAVALRAKRRAEAIADATWSALRGLSEREMMILVERMSVPEDERPTLQEIGDRIGVTRERVRQIEARAARRAKMALVARGGRRLLEAA